jgi:hypothetical protein
MQLVADSTTLAIRCAATAMAGRTDPSHGQSFLESVLVELNQMQ